MISNKQKRCNHDEIACSKCDITTKDLIFFTEHLKDEEFKKNFKFGMSEETQKSVNRLGVLLEQARKSEREKCKEDYNELKKDLEEAVDNQAYAVNELDSIRVNSISKEDLKKVLDDEKSELLKRRIEGEGGNSDVVDFKLAYLKELRRRLGV